ncbi:SCAN domain-containing protein 3 [Oopsacas minuta]|uniref:SCAN domain-containing protein 3 n=1 Tax=Oopsacas minuta TaxID=111878 RepID=A0AAV7JFH9_9METZ|nr:SCAN domain-containing protein 3 [Oopsacas minuta]
MSLTNNCGKYYDDGECRTVITSFITKLKLFKSNVSRRELRQFPNLIQNQVSTEDFLRYCGYLEDLKEDIVERFADVINMEYRDGLSARVHAICNSIADQYPALWARAKMMILSFPRSYLVEKGFSVVVGLLIKMKNRLEITKRGDLRVFLTKFSPDLKNLVTGYQA